jgi:hypothetical protein
LEASCCAAWACERSIFSGLKPHKTSNFGDRLRNFSYDPQSKRKEKKRKEKKQWQSLKQVFWGLWIWCFT